MESFIMELKSPLQARERHISHWRGEHTKEFVRAESFVEVIVNSFEPKFKLHFVWFDFLHYASPELDRSVANECKVPIPNTKCKHYQS